jgi:cell wall-associated NlpC family hydrolase
VRLERRARRLGRVLATLAMTIAAVLAWVVPTAVARTVTAANVASDLAASADTGALHAVTPTRLLDTRTGAKPAAGAVLDLPVIGTAGVPAGAAAVVVTLTATNADGPGYVTAYPCGAARPLASNVNVVAGATTPNLATVAVGPAGDICIFVSVGTHMVVDLTAWYGAGDDHLMNVAPVRVADTRQGGGKVGAGQALVINPAPGTGARAVALNVTATEPDRAGFLTVYPCDAPLPVASNVNYTAGASVADAAVVGLAADGTVCVFTSAASHVVVDLNGWFGPAGKASFTAQPPRRLADTRSAASALGAGSDLTLALSGVAVLNLTVTSPQASGYLTAYPCGSTRPVVSNLNFSAGETVANAAVVPASGIGTICVYSSVATHVVVDLNGTFSSPDLPATSPGQAAVKWGYTQVGAPYAAINPFRFGDSIYGTPWKCDDGSNPCTRIDLHGNTHTYPAGTFVYDCSGFVTAAWLHAGVDLVKAEAAWTDAMLGNLPKVDPATARVGDVVLFNYSGGGDELNSRTDHAGLFLSKTSMLHAGNGGVGVSSIDWTKLVAVVRPLG